MSPISKECPNGHLYEPDYPDSENCPYCAQVERGGYRPVKTRPIYLDAAGAEVAEPIMEAPAGAPSQGAPGGAAFGRSRTQTIYSLNEPVAGWLVATAGPLLGQDFRVPPGRNSLGRAAECRISIAGDPTVSSQQGYITYSRNRRFMLSPGEGSAILYLNGQEVLAPVELKSYDELEMGNTRLKFVAFCGERFDWSEAGE